MLILLERREDMSHEEFADYWLNDHAPLIEEMPHVQRYSADLPTQPSKAPYDGVAELVFEDMGALSAAFDSEAGQQVEADTENFVGEQTTLILEGNLQFDRR